MLGQNTDSANSANKSATSAADLVSIKSNNAPRMLNYHAFNRGLVVHFLVYVWASKRKFSPVQRIHLPPYLYSSQFDAVIAQIIQHSHTIRKDRKVDYVVRGPKGHFLVERRPLKQAIADMFGSDEHNLASEIRARFEEDMLGQAAVRLCQYQLTPLVIRRKANPSVGKRHDNAPEPDPDDVYASDEEFLTGDEGDQLDDQEWEGDRSFLAAPTYAASLKYPTATAVAKRPTWTWVLNWAAKQEPFEEWYVDPEEMATTAASGVKPRTPVVATPSAPSRRSQRLSQQQQQRRVPTPSTAGPASGRRSPPPGPPPRATTLSPTQPSSIQQPGAPSSLKARALEAAPRVAASATKPSSRTRKRSPSPTVTVFTRAVRPRTTQAPPPFRDGPSASPRPLSTDMPSPHRPPVTPKRPGSIASGQSSPRLAVTVCERALAVDKPHSSPDCTSPGPEIQRAAKDPSPPPAHARTPGTPELGDPPALRTPVTPTAATRAPPVVGTRPDARSTPGGHASSGHFVDDTSDTRSWVCLEMLWDSDELEEARRPTPTAAALKLAGAPPRTATAPPATRGPRTSPQRPSPSAAPDSVAALLATKRRTTAQDDRPLPGAASSPARPASAQPNDAPHLAPEELRRRSQVTATRLFLARTYPWATAAWFTAISTAMGVYYAGQTGPETVPTKDALVALAKAINTHVPPPVVEAKATALALAVVAFCDLRAAFPDVAFGLVAAAVDALQPLGAQLTTQLVVTQVVKAAGILSRALPAAAEAGAVAWSPAQLVALGMSHVLLVVQYPWATARWFAAMVAAVQTVHGPTRGVSGTSMKRYAEIAKDRVGALAGNAAAEKALELALPVVAYDAVVVEHPQVPFEYMAGLVADLQGFGIPVTKDVLLDGAAMMGTSL